VIRHGQHRVTEALDLARAVRPCGPRPPAPHVHAEAERPHHTNIALAPARRGSELLARAMGAPPGPANHADELRATKSRHAESSEATTAEARVATAAQPCPW